MMARTAKKPAKPLTAEQRDVAEGHMNVAYGRTRRWIRRYPWLRDEIRSAAGLALMETVADYAPDQEWPLVAKICWKVDCRVLDMVRKRAPLGHRNHNWEGPIPKTVQLGSLPEGLHPYEEAARDIPEISLSCLNPREREIVKLAFWDGMSQKDIAKKLGIAQSRVSCSYQAALKQLKFAMTG
jgi:RNA polymerase sigma-B factor